MIHPIFRMDKVTQATLRVMKWLQGLLITMAVKISTPITIGVTGSTMGVTRNTTSMHRSVIMVLKIASGQCVVG